MLRIVAENLAENAIRYAGHGATLSFAIRRAGARCSPGTTASASPSATCRASSSASTAPTPRARRAEPVSASRSSSTSSRAGAAERLRPALHARSGAGLEIRCRLPPCCLGVDRLQRLLGRDEHRLRQRRRRAASRCTATSDPGSAPRRPSSAARQRARSAAGRSRRCRWRSGTRAQPTSAG